MVQTFLPPFLGFKYSVVETLYGNKGMRKTEPREPSPWLCVLLTSGLAWIRIHSEPLSWPREASKD